MQRWLTWRRMHAVWRREHAGRQGATSGHVVAEVARGRRRQHRWRLQLRLEHNCLSTVQNQTRMANIMDMVSPCSIFRLAASRRYWPAGNYIGEFVQNVPKGDFNAQQCVNLARKNHVNRPRPQGLKMPQGAVLAARGIVPRGGGGGGKQVSLTPQRARAQHASQRSAFVPAPKLWHPGMKHVPRILVTLPDDGAAAKQQGITKQQVTKQQGIAAARTRVPSPAASLHNKQSSSQAGESRTIAGNSVPMSARVNPAVRNLRMQAASRTAGKQKPGAAAVRSIYPSPTILVTNPRDGKVMRSPLVGKRSSIDDKVQVTNIVCRSTFL